MLAWRHLVLIVLAACTFESSVEDPESADLEIGFEFTDSGADELSGTVTIPVVLSRASESPVSVSYALLAGGNATPGTDFTLDNGTLVFAAGETRREIPATIRDEGDMTEAVETFSIALSSPMGAKLDQKRAIHKVTIADHVLPRVRVSGVMTSTNENVPSQLMLFLDRPAEANSTVTIGVGGGMMYGINVAQDVTITDNIVVTIPTGAMSHAVPIGEKNDSLDEEDETAVFTLRGASTNLVLGVTRTQNHTIIDDDPPPTVAFESAARNVPENVLLGVTTIDVRLSTASGRTVLVDYRRDAADTADGNDATVLGSPGTVIFNPGDTSETIYITIDNDDIDEDNETVIINLSNPRNTTITGGTYTATIQDNDTAIANFSMTSRTVTEGATVTLDVTLNRQSAKTVTVPFTVTGGTAGSDDYTVNTSSPLTFNPLETTKSIVIQTIDNSPGNEADETVIIDMGTPTGGAQRGSANRFTLTIQES